MIKAKDDLSQEEETDMLDYLYTTQYQMRGILAVSLGIGVTFDLQSHYNKATLIAVSTIIIYTSCF